MGTKLKDKIASLPANRRARVEEEGARLIAEYTTLQSLRKACAITQAELAERQGVSQANIAGMEKRDDMLISTLGKTVENLGGTLKLLVEFPDKPPVFLTGLGDLVEEA